MAEPIGSGGEGTRRRPDEPMLSVVVITHNERDRIDACLESVFAACEPLDRFEVVLVDSRSTDGTVELARQHPVTILELPAEPTVTPSAGRYVGTAATDGDLILFVDGDMILTDGWLDAAAQRIRETPGLAGLDGHLGEPAERASIEANENADGDALQHEPIDVLRGVALYDREPLTEVGGFDPHVQAMEDIDLSFRLDAAGYDLGRLSTVVATHPPRSPAGDRRRRWKNGYYHGRGELFRKYLTRPRLFARLAYRTRLFLGALAWASAGPVARVVAGTKGALAWVVGTLAALAGISRVQGTDWTTDKLIACGPVLAGMVLGFPGSPPDSHEYPLDAVETVQTAPPVTETETVSVA